MPVAAAIVMAAATAYSIHEQKKAAKAQQSQIDEQKKMQDNELRKIRLDARRKARAARASVLAAGEAAGAGESSAMDGSLGNITTSTASNEGFLVAQNNLQTNILNLQKSEVKYKSRASTGAAIGSLAGSFTGGNIWSSVFKTPGKATTGANSQK